MANNEISKYIIGIIIFTLFIMGGIAMIGEFGLVDPSFIADDRYTQFNDTFNKYTDVTAQADTLQEDIEGADTDWGAFGVLNSLIGVAWNTVTTIFTSFSFMNDAFIGLNTIFGVPIWVSSLIIAIVIIIIVFAIISAIFQRSV